MQTLILRGMFTLTGVLAAANSGCGLNSAGKDGCKVPSDCLAGFVCNPSTSTCENEQGHTENEQGHATSPDARPNSGIADARPNSGIADAPPVDALTSDSGDIGRPNPGLADAALADAMLDFRDCGAAPDADSGAATCGDTQTVKYVASKLRLPRTASESHAFALDIDGDGFSDNALGGLIASLDETADLDNVQYVDEQVLRGDLIQLFELNTTDFASSRCAAVTTHVGVNPAPTPCFDPDVLATCGRHLQGYGAFEVASTTPYVSRIRGDVQGNLFSTAHAGTAFVFLSIFGGAPEPVRVNAAQIRAQTFAEALEDGLLGGGISNTDIHSKVIPALHRSFAVAVSTDCTPSGQDCGCTDGSRGASLLDFFDEDSDCEITLSEVFDNKLVAATLRNPDLDLLDASGRPGTDGVNDHLSIGLGFSAVRATF